MTSVNQRSVACPTDHSPWPVCITFLAVFLLPTMLAAHGGEGSLEYEPCHVFCSNEPGRVENATFRPVDTHRRFAFSLLTAYVSPQGHYEEGDYFPISENAYAHVVEVIARGSYRISESLRAQVSLPFEYNYSKNLVLPTLYETDTRHAALEPDGITVMVDYKIPRVFFHHFFSRIGGGYRFSMPAGTIDVSGELEEQPDKALEALGFGSDDLFLSGGITRVAASGRWDIGVGGEWRIHTLPRFRRLFATTYAYYMDVRRVMGRRWDVYGRVSGFTTRVHSMDVTQANRAILTAGGYFHYSPTLSFFWAAKGELPFEAVNRNSLSTVGINWGITVFR